MALDAEGTMKFRPCGVGESLFELINDYWGNLRSDARVFHRICTIVRLMGVQTCIIENLSPADEEFARFEQEAIAIKTRLGENCVKVSAIKLTFIREIAKTLEDLKAIHGQGAADGLDNAFLGYAILAEVELKGGDKWSYIFESILQEIGKWNDQRKWSPLDHCYIHVKRWFQCKVTGLEYKIRGCYFRQQNSITNFCGHACASMLLNNLPETKEIIAAESVNRTIGVDHIERKFKLPEGLVKFDLSPPPSRVEVKTPQLREFFHEHGYDGHPIQFSPGGLPIMRSFIYGFVESQFPAMVSFLPLIDNIAEKKNAQPNENDLQEHVVAVVGHTLSIHSWLPVSHPYSEGLPREHISALAWVDQLVIHDDNCGMQFTLPAHAFKPAIHPDQPWNFEASEALGIFPSKFNIKLLGHEAIAIAAAALRKLAETDEDKNFQSNRYTNRLLTADKKALHRNVVFRAVLVHLDDYIDEFPLNVKDFTETAEHIAHMQSRGIKHVWLVEATERDLYVGNQAKIIDVILNPSWKMEYDLKNRPKDCTPGSNPILMIRLPQGMLLPKPYTDEWDVLPGWEISGHLPLYRHREI